MINYKRTVLPNQVVPIAGATYNLFTDEQGRSIRGNLRGSDKVSLFITSSINLTASSSVQLVCKKNDGTVVEAKTLSLSGVVANTAKTIIIDDSVVEASDYFLMIITAEPNSSTYTLNVRVECSGGAGNEEVDWGEIGGQITDQSDLDNQFAKLPITDVVAPTTSTVGQLGEVRFDTDGKCWMLRKIDGSTYTWERLFTDIVLTQTQYNAIVIKDPNARYMIVGA